MKKTYKIKKLANGNVDVTGHLESTWKMCKRMDGTTGLGIISGNLPSIEVQEAIEACYVDGQPRTIEIGKDVDNTAELDAYDHATATQTRMMNY